MDNHIEYLIDECKRQEESCLYTSTALFEWLKSMRIWRVVFVIAPIILGGISTWSLLTHRIGYEWITGTCALLAGIIPAIYKALDFDVSLDVISQHAYQYKSLQDRFRQTWRITALEDSFKLRPELDILMSKMDEVRSASLTPPERFFRSARKKIKDGHYRFTVDEGKAG